MNSLSRQVLRAYANEKLDPDDVGEIAMPMWLDNEENRKTVKNLSWPEFKTKMASMFWYIDEDDIKQCYDHYVVNWDKDNGEFYDIDHGYFDIKTHYTPPGQKAEPQKPQWVKFVKGEQ